MVNIEIYQGSKLLYTELEVNEKIISELENSEYMEGEFSFFLNNVSNEDDYLEFAVDQSGLFKLLDQLDINPYNLGCGTEFIFYMINVDPGMGTFRVFHDSDVAEEFEIRRNHEINYARTKSEEPWFIENVRIETIILTKMENEEEDEDNEDDRYYWYAPYGNPITGEKDVDEDDFMKIIESLVEDNEDNNEDYND